MQNFLRFLSVTKNRAGFYLRRRQNLGFTLIEMLVVFSVIGLLTGGGFASFVSYSKKQIIDQVVQDLKTGIDQAKFNAVSRVKPSVGTGCDNVPLDRYRLRVCAGVGTCTNSANLYEISAGCVVGTGITWTSVLTSRPRPSTITATTGCTMQFSVLSGINAPCSIVVTDGSVSKTICVDGGGNTSVLDGTPSCGAGYLPVTPAPTSVSVVLLPTPTSIPGPPSIIAQSGSVISASTNVTLTSTVNPNGGTVSITYRYSTVNGTCSSLASTNAGPTGLTGTANNSPNAANLSGLSGNTTYYYCATANNNIPGGEGLIQGVGNNNLSNGILTIPGAPAITTVGSPTRTSLTANWTAPAGGTGWYDLYYCDRNADGACTPSIKANTSGNIPGTSLSFVHDTTITCAKIYAYIVRGVNTSGSSANSNIVTGTTSACPLAPTINTPTSSSVTSSTALLGANIASDGGATVTARGICWSTSTTSPDLTNGATCSGTTGTYAVGSWTQTVTGLPSSSRVYYRGYATNSAGSSYTANGIYIDTPAACTNTTYYRDADADGYGNPSLTQVFCVPGASTTGYVTNNNDCDDTTNTIILGSSRTRYQSSSVGCGTACASQTQTCGAGGVWSGTYSSTSCTASTRTAYSWLSSSCGYYGNNNQSQTCQTSGAWSGTYTQTSPVSVSTQYGCAASSVACGSSCSCTTKTCTSGGWSPNYPYGSCTVASCTYCYTDSDGDGERANSTVVSTPSGSCPAGQTSNTTYTDCYDSSSLARHTQTGYFNYASYPNGRGDSSWDFNCSSFNEMQYTGTSTLYMPNPASNTCVISQPGGTVAWQNSFNCPCGGECTKRVCGGWSGSGCGAWSGAAVSSNWGASCPAGYGSYVVGFDYAVSYPSSGNLYQGCH